MESRLLKILGVGHPIRNTVKSILDEDFTEVNEQTGSAVAQPELGQDLFVMDRSKLLHRL